MRHHSFEGNKNHQKYYESCVSFIKLLVRRRYRTPVRQIADLSAGEPPDFPVVGSTGGPGCVLLPLGGVHPALLDDISHPACQGLGLDHLVRLHRNDKGGGAVCMNIRNLQR